MLRRRPPVRDDLADLLRLTRHDKMLLRPAGRTALPRLQAALRGYRLTVGPTSRPGNTGPEKTPVIAEAPDGSEAFTVVTAAGAAHAWAMAERIARLMRVRVRPCLCCGGDFVSTGPGHRMCGRCRLLDEGL